MDQQTSFPDSLVYFDNLSLRSDSLELLADKGRTILWITVREGRKFLLKGLSEELRYRPQDISLLRKEYSLGLRLNHPHIAGVYGFEEHPQTGPVILMEYVDGISLNTFLSEKDTESRITNGKEYKSKNTLRDRLLMAIQIADALSYLHSLGLAHRDLKPDNILLTRKHRDIKIIDLGLGDSEDFMIHKISLGTEEFGAPEQQTPIVGDTKADIFSYGKILENLLPERKFRSIRNSCLKENPEDRENIEIIKEKLERLVNKGDKRIIQFLISAVAILSTVVLFLFLLLFQNRKELSSSQESSSIPAAEKTSAPKDTIIKVVSEPSQNNPAYNQDLKVINDNEGVDKITTREGNEKNNQDNIYPEEKQAVKSISDITEIYYHKVEDIINKYGSILDLPLKEKSEAVLKRKDEMTDIENQMVKELSDNGYTLNEITKERDAFWFYSVQKMNQIENTQPLR